MVAIDLLRFGAATMVMLCHYFGQWELVEQLPAGSATAATALPTNNWFHSGWVGVEIFFVISGYVIALSATNSTAVDFARRRFLRLWPGALICASLSALVLLIVGVPLETIAPRYWASAAMWLWAEQIDPVYWTLQVECIFYALVTLLLAIGRWAPVKVGLALSIWSLTYLLWMSGPFAMAAPEITGVAELLLGTFGAFFGMGILIQQSHRDPASVKAWMFLPSLVAAPICIGGQNAIDGGQGSAEAQLMFVAGVAVVLLSNRFQAVMTSERVRRVAIALGLATYPLYLMHQFVGEALLIGAASLGISSMVAVGPVMVLMVVTALGIALWVEPRIRAPLNRLLRPRSVPVPEPAV